MINKILSLHKDLNLNIVQFDWPARYGFPLYDIEAQIEYLGIKCEGRGTAKTEEGALSKALCEAIERYIVNAKKLGSSNGTACHISIENAQKCAENELLERDAFLCHFYLNVPAMEYGPFDAKGLINQAKTVLNEMNINLSFALMAGANNSTIALCKANGENYKLKFGDIFGLAFGDDSSSFEHALFEVLRDVFAIADSGINTISLGEFEKINLHNPNDHLKLSLDFDYSSMVSFPTNSKTLNRPTLNTVELHSTEIQDELLKKLGLYFIQTKSDHVQNIFWGNFNTDKINYKRLESYRELGLTGAGIRKYPHPFG